MEKWLTWAQEWKVWEPILTQEYDLNLLGSRVRFGSNVSSKKRKRNYHSFSINEMWPSKIGGSVSSSIGIGINVGLGIGSKSSKDTEVNIDSKIKIESQS